ncbi:hypothetical protein BASA50_000162 [Batrachochytrium salamandrivorans]|uniref:Pentacotripeptide-repeat region of PRORP domain-containing protein n=1 Tax=Batrachochytrium salamandrivorans TaxID=1357716 RepID=A0ABQ8EUD7_9FUNG|nr:hypothetical protein BASA50_000162 [Batrachochytrium salamandrivorans]KAH9264294.1 hypothetical protein BASA83_012249 [Batrachochytrium salamandrivorans]KAJ1341361.1 hypothetical protein BSLG_004091 [Batrachochytrium salamandrivorans]
MQMMVGRYRPATMHSTVAAAHATTCSADLLWRAVAVGSHIPTCLFSAATGTRENGPNSGCTESTTAFQSMSLLPACRVDLLTKPVVVASLGVMDLATPRHSRSRKPHFSHSPVARTDTRHGRHQPRLEHYKNPRCPKTTPWTISDLLRAIRDNNPHYAYSIFQSIEGTNPSLLADVQSFYIALIIESVLQNKHFSSKHEQMPRRLLRASSILRLMSTLGMAPSHRILCLSIFICGGLGDISGVDAAYCQIKALGPRYITKKVITRMCQANIKCGREAEGLEFFNQLLTIDRSARSVTILAQAYSLRGDEAGMLRVLDSATIPNMDTNPTVLSTICMFYQQKNDYAAISKHIAQFKSKGGRVTSQVYLLYMRVANTVGKYQETLSIFSQMLAEDVESNNKILNQLLIAHACLSHTHDMWRVYSQLCRSNSVESNTKHDMVKAIGPIPGTDVLDNLKVISMHLSIPLATLFLDCLVGYASLGDVASTTVLMKELEAILRNLPAWSHDQMVLAYFHSAEVDALLSYVESLEAQNVRISHGTWYTVLLCVMKYRPEMIDSTADRIQSKIPELFIDDWLDRGRDSISISRASTLPRGDLPK